MKGHRKLIAMGAGLLFGVFYIVACKIDPGLKDLVMFALAIEGLPAGYMGVNLIRARLK